MALDIFALQSALYARLKAEIADVPVFQHVPQDQAYPYIRIDGLDVSDDGTKTTEMWDIAVTLSAFDKNVSSTRPILTILKRMHAALHDQETALDVQQDGEGQIILAGYEVVLIRFEMQQAFQQGKPDDQYYHGVQRYRVILQQL
ncbi:MAG: DUF3168 domain-containing protein [Acetobacteraceae bacterium]